MRRQRAKPVESQLNLVDAWSVRRPGGPPPRASGHTACCGSSGTSVVGHDQDTWISWRSVAAAWSAGGGRVRGRGRRVAPCRSCRRAVAGFGVLLAGDPAACRGRSVTRRRVAAAAVPADAAAGSPGVWLAGLPGRAPCCAAGGRRPRSGFGCRRGRRRPMPPPDDGSAVALRPEERCSPVAWRRHDRSHARRSTRPPPAARGVVAAEPHSSRLLSSQVWISTTTASTAAGAIHGA